MPDLHNRGVGDDADVTDYGLDCENRYETPKTRVTQKAEKQEW